MKNYGIVGKRGSKWGKYEAEYGLTLGQRKILDIIKEKSTLSTSVSDTAVIEASGLPADEVHIYFSQLQALGFVKHGVDFSRVNITKQGLNEGKQKKSIRNLMSLWLRRPSQ